MFEVLRDKWQREHAKEQFASTGHKISNRGKMWITDGIEQKMIHRSEPIPAGWQKGRLPPSLETRAKLSEGNRNRVITEETRAKLRARPNAWIGRKHTEETKQKMREAKQRRKND
jgi:hypothetical protein